MAPSPAPAAELAAPQGVVADVEMSFDIVNYDYGDLEKAASGLFDEAERGTALLQSEKMFGEVITCTIGEVYEQLITEGLENVSKAAPAVSSSMPLAGASMPQGWEADSAAASSAVDPSEEQVDVFVTFRPCPDRRNASDSLLQKPREAERMATTIHVVITDKPGTGANLLPEVFGILSQVQASDRLRRRMRTALFQATGITPRIRGLSAPVTAELKQWAEGSCERHVERLVGQMEVAYTRRMVPLALYNECTNFIPFMSFSHDHVSTRLDRKKCRTAAIKFAKRWDYGKADWAYGAGDGHEPMDLSAFCRDVCETRFGEGAPQCGVTQQLQQGI